MTVEQSVTQERRADSHQQINSLVSSRTETLAVYSELASRQPLAKNPEVPKLLQRFCQTMIDYTASAHFALYKYIDENSERRKPVLEIAGRIYPKIIDITQIILDFNDKYDCEGQCEKLDQLADDLSKVGEALADRIEMEDKLIQALTKGR